MSAVFGNWGMSIKRRRIAANVKQYVDATNVMYQAADVEPPQQVPTPMEGESMMRQAMLRVVRALEPYGSGVRAGDVQSEFTSMQTKRTAMQVMLRALLPKAAAQSKGLKKEALLKMNALLGRLGDAFVTYSTMAQLATLLESGQVEAPVQAVVPPPPPSETETDPLDEADQPPEEETDQPPEGYSKLEGEKPDDTMEGYTKPDDEKEAEPMEVDEGESKEEVMAPPSDFPAAEEKTGEVRPPTYREWLSRQAPKTEGVREWIALIDSDPFYDLSMRNEDQIMQMVELYEPYKDDDKLADIPEPYRTFWEFHKEDLKNLDEVINAAGTYSKDEKAPEALKKLADNAKDYIKQGVAPLTPPATPPRITRESTEASKRVFLTPSKEVTAKLPDSPQGITLKKEFIVVFDKKGKTVDLKKAETPLYLTADEMLENNAAYIAYKGKNYKITGENIKKFRKKFRTKFGTAA